MSGPRTIDITKIDALSELFRNNFDFEHRGDGEVCFICPCHPDKTPSAFLNIRNNLWKCHAAQCGAKGDIVELLARIRGEERKAVIADLKTRYSIENKKMIDIMTVETYHSQISKAGTLLQKLTDRGIGPDIIRQYRLGYDHQSNRIIIPIPDIDGDIINLRKYRPGAPGNEKFKNQYGMKVKALYPIAKLSYDKIIITAGEMKALVLNHLLNKHGIGAVCVTSGEGAWDTSFNHLFEGKEIYICYDIDEGGRIGGAMVAKTLLFTVPTIKIMNLPMNPKEHPKGDVNDFVGRLGATDTDLLACMEKAELYVPEKQAVDPSIAEMNGEVEKVVLHSLSELSGGTYVGRRFECEAMIANEDTDTYVIPKLVAVNCNGEKNDNCIGCPISAIEKNENGEKLVTVPRTHPELLNMINCPVASTKIATRNACGIPESCSSASVIVKEHYKAVETRITQPLSAGGDNRDYTMFSAFMVDLNDMELNTPYIMTGRMFPAPKTQSKVLLIDGYKEGTDSLYSFSPTEEEMNELKLLQPVEWTEESIQSSLDRRYHDLSYNITNIYKRDDLHLFIDLCYHSCLYYKFDGRVSMGVVELVIVGDSAQGKSETTTRLMEHYKLGIRSDCKNATVAGLLGGLQQIGSRWFISWGVLPTQDKRLVIMEELKGASTETISRLTDMRSSGIAELSKIEKRKAHARTRKIMLSNPRSGNDLSSYNFGIEAISELIGNPEDVRRFDFGMVVSAGQVNASEINKLSRYNEHVEHEYTTEICRRAILWAWTRAPEQIVFEEGAEDKCLEFATALCARFTDKVPLCDKGTMRHKIAKLAISLAAMTFSSQDEDSSTILVRNCHVQFIKNMLNKQYSSKEFGYLDFTNARVFAEKISDEKGLKECFLTSRFPSEFVNHILHQNEITLNDLCDWCEMDSDSARKILSLLVRKHALIRGERWYYKTAGFIKLLKEWQQQDVFARDHNNSGKLDNEEF